MKAQKPEGKYNKSVAYFLLLILKFNDFKPISILGRMNIFKHSGLEILKYILEKYSSHEYHIPI